MANDVPELENRLLEFLYDAKTQAPPGHSGEIYLLVAADGIGVSRATAAKLVIRLREKGLVAVNALDTVRISSEGYQTIDRARRFLNRKWIERHPVLGYRLSDLRPASVPTIREALDEAAEIMNSAQGPGATAYEQARVISDLLKQDLQIALARETATAARKSFWASL